MSDIKYTADGQRVQVLATLASGRHLVAGQVGGHEDDEPYFDTDNTRVVDRVFDVAPVEIHEKRVSDLLDEVARLEKRRAKLRDEISAAERSHKDRIAKLSKYDCLHLVEDFVDGKITHYVISDSYYYEQEGHYSLRINTPQNEKPNGEGRAWDKKLKLLVLFGDPSGSMEWKLSRYSDGSSNSDACVWPCTSLESAQAKARELFEIACQLQQKSSQQWRRATDLKRSAMAIGVPVPEWIDASIRKLETEIATRERDEAEQKLLAANRKLADLQS